MDDPCCTGEITITDVEPCACETCPEPTHWEICIDDVPVCECGPPSLGPLLTLPPDAPKV